jgi:hypothetical protein
MASIFLVSSCGQEADLSAFRAGARRKLALTSSTLLHDDSATLLVKPEWISESPGGRIVITDISDRNVKVYDDHGTVVRVVGRAGRGPGEFAGLMTAQSYGDSIVAYDFDGGRLSVFGPDGHLARALALGSRDRPAPFSVRVIDDSLFLLVAALPSRQKRAMLSLIRPDGSTRSRFLDLDTYIGHNPAVVSAVGLIADGADGRIFASVAGGDSVWAFDYDGRRLGAFPADPVNPLVPVRSLIESNHGSIRRAGGYVVDGNRMIIGLVALDSGTVALQIAAYDGRKGIDPVEGGTVVVSTLGHRGAYVLARQELPGGLFGRDRRGRLLFLRYTSPEAEAHELLRGTLAARVEAP